jgi:hypothetical protein
MDRLDNLAQEARELLVEMDAMLASLNANNVFDIAKDIHAPINDFVDDWL